MDALKNFEYHIVSLMLDDMCCTKKTVRSHSPDEKYNLLAGGGRSGQCGQWQCSYWGLVTASLDTLNLIIVVGGFQSSGHCARMSITDASTCDHDR